MILVADAISIPLPDKSVDLVFGSPPYCDARTYGIGAQRDCQEWIDWMLAVTTECLRVSRGPVVWVAAGVTRGRTYWPACEGLMYEWWKRGGSMYRPCYWHRVGIPGSGGDQWFRADVEYVMCFKRSGPLPWTENTAMGHAPKWAPGGEMSYRLADGARRSKWGGTAESTMNRDVNGKRKTASPGMCGRLTKAEKLAAGAKLHTKRDADVQANGESMREQAYLPPAIANPGNLIRTTVGGGQLGDPLSHESEAPFPERLAEFFVRSLCPPGGTVYDPFSGSGTTAAVARRFGRNFVASDIRESQAKLTAQRVKRAQVELFA